MKTMVKSAGLDTTNKVHTNQSLSKTLVRKLKKGGAQSHEIMAILHRNEKSLGDYDTLDDDDHQHLGRMFNSASKTAVVPAKPHPMDTTCTHQSLPFNLSHVPVLLQNCNVYFGSTQCTSTQQSYSYPAPKRSCVTCTSSYVDSD